MKNCILALDQGTSSSRAIVFDSGGRILSMAQKEFPQHFPRAGWVEHDPIDIWSSESAVIAEALAAGGLGASDIAAIGITNQRETTIVWDALSGKPVCNAIVWQDRRTADYCESLKGQGLAGMIREKTGLIPDAYFSATKIRWILENVPGARQSAESGRLRFGTVDSWLVWNLTGGKVHATDVSNASRTMLFNIHTLRWDEELLALFGIPASMLPEVRDSSGIYGYAAEGSALAGVPVAGIAGDQQSALFGQMCISPGEVKNTYGTGCFLLMNTGGKPVLSGNSLLTTVAWKIGDRVDYALEGSIFAGGSAVQWLRDGLGIISSSSEVESLAASVSDNGGVYFVPALTGLGAPWWDAGARGTICGLTRGSTAAHIARATLEGIAFQTMDIVHAMERDSGVHLSGLKVDGGASRNNLLMQFQADVLGTAVVRPEVTETTALGACYLAGLAVGIWKSPEDIRSSWKEERVFRPCMPPEKAEELRKGWADALKRSFSAGKQYFCERN